MKKLLLQNTNVWDHLDNLLKDGPAWDHLDEMLGE